MTLEEKTKFIGESKGKSINICLNNIYKKCKKFKRISCKLIKK